LSASKVLSNFYTAATVRTDRQPLGSPVAKQ